MSKVVNPENVGTVQVRYAFAPRLREYLRDAPPGCGHRVRVVETRVEVAASKHPTAPPEQVLVVVYDLAPADAPGTDGDPYHDGEG